MKRKQKIIGHIHLTQASSNKNYPNSRAKSSSHFKTQSQAITNLITQVERNSFGQVSLTQSHSLSPQNRLGRQISRSLLPPKSFDKKTLVLDLDETLVHSGFVPFSCPSDLTIQIELESDIYDIHVLVRPYVKEFLEKMSKHFEIVIFTASLSKYANPLLNIIDQNGHCPFRLFREHCTLINTAFVKDLARLGRDLKDIIILDNSPVAYALNQDNGFPITSWFDNRKDNELLKVAPILEFLSYVPDVREYIRKFVSGNKIQYDKVSSIIKTYHNKLKNNQIPLSMRNKIASYHNSLHLKQKSNSITNMFIEKKLNSNCDKNPEHDHKSSCNSVKSPLVKKRKWKGRQISITSIDFINSNYKKENNNINSNNLSPSSTEIYHLKSLPCSYGVYSQMNTMRTNSSSKKIIHLVTKEKSIHIQTLRTELSNILKTKYKGNNHKTKIYSQRCNKQ